VNDWLQHFRAYGRDITPKCRCPRALRRRRWHPSRTGQTRCHPELLFSSPAPPSPPCARQLSSPPAPFLFFLLLRLRAVFCCCSPRLLVVGENRELHCHPFSTIPPVLLSIDLLLLPPRHRLPLAAFRWSSFIRHRRTWCERASIAFGPWEEAVTCKLDTRTPCGMSSVGELRPPSNRSGHGDQEGRYCTIDVNKGA
jgi:hypothetical protein